MESKWKGVPENKIKIWRSIFRDAPMQEGTNLSAPCPVCEKQSLHRYYWLVKEDPRELRGQMFKGPGSCWEWCSDCGSFEHLQVFVPADWLEPALPIDHATLTVEPGLIEDTLRKLNMSNRG